jgi:hypothetical protein
MKAIVKNSGMTHRWGLIVVCVMSLTAITIQILSINGLGPIDDHQFIRTIFQGKSFGTYISPELGRFLPLTSQEYVLAARIFEPSPHLFFVISAMKALVCGVLLLRCLILTGASNWTIAILWGVGIFSIGFANAAFRLQVAEINLLVLVLLFLWITLVSATATQPLSKKQNIVVASGVAAIAVGFLYKELFFIFALAFGGAELLRCYRQEQSVPRQIWALLILGACYIGFYGLWRFFYTTGSYASFHSNATSDIILFFIDNDPFIIFVVLPLTAYRMSFIVRDANEHSVYDSFLLAAMAYTAAYLLLRIYSPYYLLPAYAFAICGVSGILASQSAIKIKAFVLFLSALFGLNTLPTAVSDMHALKSIANNHYRFVQSLAEWLLLNPMPNSERRNLILAGVSRGNGVEILVSLDTFLVSLGVPESSFSLKATEPDNAPNITAFYREQQPSIFRGDDIESTAKTDDLVIFNPYQHAFIPPPLLAPSYREIYRGRSEWGMPRWRLWDWALLCMFSPHNCASRIFENMRYTGYTAMLVTRPVATIRLTPVKSPSYRIGPLELPRRKRAGSEQKLDILIENTGTEIWPASGTLSPGIFVNLAYRWFDKNNRVVLEGNRAPFPESMQPNDRAKVSIILKTPKKRGKYKLVISPVQEHLRWFSNDATAGIEIEVF